MCAPPLDPGLTPVRGRAVEAWLAVTERAAATRGRHRRQIRVGSRWHQAARRKAWCAALHFAATERLRFVRFGAPPSFLRKGQLNLEKGSVEST